MSDDILIDCETCDAAARIAAFEAENEKLRAALDCFMGKETPTQWRYGRNHAEELAKGILAAAALKETDG